ncbi:50S ribosomal protein L25/general stress protein Ctc [Metabacillus fastidiosus]|uniref:Large ribosomal subunit protein bL25 n=1 Tax=Metabacillus fastidiosus TaxID=1458 RepID=A0ABU6P4A0_9BACI|nr:50S ribosomal protein L25/general stress protein Ctc [Metabacillus fastidiosus]MED4404166.1 50S ribosomal protein L25/general stress protein Ctc [Metabacillus fastidiosus]MED4455575.1 50S ribosomal protein L25/general stress protein Ctc [Metabacillus fastidiosus]MED4464717.1 50S ribosomal protein L25/general stress protein Ctc [Metabacillus fastidiosus]
MTTLQAQERTEFTSSAKRRIREQGQIPAVVYGKETESKSVSLDAGELLKKLRDEGRNAILQLHVGDASHPVMLSDYQMDPIRNQLVHADFQIVDMQSEVEVEVPVNLIGTSQGVKDGGVLQQSLHQILVKAKPGDIPQTIDVDVSNLGVNEVISVKDISSSGNYSLVQDEEQVIASILPPQQEKEIDSGEEQEPGEPTNQEG